ncbi:MAG: tetratricopeptide repeat protein, partial [Steroidobacteraceae bacterium]|nr:tetratricopeptide repeat protein [Steroidobacteraceae bacterium]
RAGALETVLPRLAEADNALAAGDFLAAIAAYETVLKADPNHQRARDGLTRARGAASAELFARTMGAGLAALRAGRFADARTQLERARSLRPDAPEVAAALAQLDARGSGLDLNAQRERIEQLEATERWAEAEQAYEALLRSDPSIEFARAGRSRVAPRAELARRLQGLIDQPDRLASAEVRDAARRWLDEARSVAQPGPVLRSQIARLELLLPEFEKPVKLVLQSDNQTEVSILKVGALGSFMRQEVELLPGSYVVMGTRTGYRDVRHEIVVKPGAAAPTIDVRCIEPI